MTQQIAGCSLMVAIFLCGCRPATSEIVVETVNQTLAAQMAAKADTSVLLIPSNDLKEVHPLFVNGIQYIFKATNATTTIWMDEQDHIVALIEREKTLLKDSIEFYQNGQRMFTLPIGMNGSITGWGRYFYPDGRVKADGRFTNGGKTGIWRFFYPSGKLEKVVDYDKENNQNE